MKKLNENIKRSGANKVGKAVSVIALTTIFGIGLVGSLFQMGTCDNVIRSNKYQTGFFDSMTTVDFDHIEAPREYKEGFVVLSDILEDRLMTSDIDYVSYMGHYYTEKGIDLYKVTLTKDNKVREVLFPLEEFELYEDVIKGYIDSEYDVTIEIVDSNSYKGINRGLYYKEDTKKLVLMKESK